MALPNFIFKAFYWLHSSLIVCSKVIKVSENPATDYSIGFLVSRKCIGFWRLCPNILKIMTRNFRAVLFFAEMAMVTYRSNPISWAKYIPAGVCRVSKNYQSWLRGDGSVAFPKRIWITRKVNKLIMPFAPKWERNEEEMAWGFPPDPEWWAMS